MAPKALVTMILFAGVLAGQETRGMIYGRVLDAQAAAVSRAVVTVTNTDTNTSARLICNDTGYYEASLLLPGKYQVAVDAPGFRKSLRSGLVLSVSTRLEINMELEVGAVSETVTVTAESPILDTSTVSSGRVMDNRTLSSIPVIGSNAMVLVKFTPGIQTSGVNNWLGLHSNIGNSDYSTGGKVGGNEWSIDGVPNDGNNRQTAYMPHADQVQEFKVETSSFDASIGHTSGASISMMTKSGANSLHGTITEEHWQQRWNGTPFFIKQAYYRNIAAAQAAGNTALANRLRSEDKQPSGHEHNYAGAVGGPVILPRIYDGRNKLFFFFNHNGFKDIRSEEPNNINRTLPTLANRSGDFSELLSIGPRYQIYDPLTVRVDPARAGHFVRDPLPGNILQPSRIVNPAYKSYLKLLPVPNNDPASPAQEPLRNYVAVATPLNFQYKAYANRVDYHHSSRHRFFGRWSWNDYNEDRGDWTYETARGLNSSGLSRHNLGATVDWVYTASPSTVIDFAIAGNEFRDGNKLTVPFQYKPSDVGLPAYLDAKAGGQTILPTMSFSGYEKLGRNVPVFTRYRILTGKADVSHVRGKHSLRGGFDERQHFRTNTAGGNTSGAFGFSNNYTRRNDDTFTPAGDLGLSWAAFMMGLPDSMSVATNDTFASHTPYYAWYVQDNWRLTPRLTLNLGLRMEYEQGATERYNRAIGYFDPAAKLPISDAAIAAYQRNPAPELSPPAFSVPGGSVYPGVRGAPRQLWQSAVWLPRAAIAWQANSKTVFRAGYGIFYDTLNVLNEGPDQTGFSRTTSTLLTNDFGVNWLAGNPYAGISPLTDPFPVRSDGTRFDVPTRDALGLMARAGRGWSFIDFNRPHARQQRWRVAVQRELVRNMAIEVAYAASRSSNVPIGQSLSPVPEQFWASGLQRNDTVANNLNANVTNPFNIQNFAGLRTSDPLVYQDMTTQGFFTSSTIRKSQLLRPFPQMNGLTNNASPLGRVRTDELQIVLDRRFSQGLAVNFGYTLLRGRAADFFSNEFDTAPTWRETNNTRPHRIVATCVYELPFGKGRRWARSGVPSWFFGGFQFSATYEWQPGPLLDWGNLFYYGSDIGEINAVERTLDRWFNTDNFERNAARLPAAFHRRVFPTRIEGLRADMTNQWNVNAQREFKIRERVAFQLRFDAINLQNRSQFAGPVVSPTATDFGRVVSQSAALNRLLQLHGRLTF